ncbi:MAG: sulfatase [Lentimonas sp.]
MIVIFTDDQGYEDLGCFGSPKIKTPEIDQMASEGLRLESFYVAASVCSASRASLLTGRYTHRHGIGGAFFPNRGGMPQSEVTVAEVLKAQGYTTACFGKWHLGDLDKYLPTNQGFDEYFGIPYSNDMYLGPTLRFADEAVFREGYTLERAKADQVRVAEIQAQQSAWKGFKESGLKNKVPLMEGDAIVEYPTDQALSTQRFFDRAIEFVTENKEEPFFIFITPAMPHIPLYASDAFAGKSERGSYGDVIEEIDHNVGRLLKHLKTMGLAENTMVIFTSDNGPWLSFGKDGGSAGPLKGGKFSNYEGGIREPCVVWWPRTIPAGSKSEAIVSAVDLFPTFLSLAGAPLPSELIIDGMDHSAFLFEPTDEGLRNRLYFATLGDQPKTYGVREGDWKYLRMGGQKYQLGPELYNLSEDVTESNNLINEHPEVVERMEQLLEDFY